MKYLNEIRERRDALKIRKGELSQELNQLNIELQALETILSINDGGEPHPSNTFPFSGTLQDKVMFALSALQKATANELAEYIIKNDPSVKKDSIVITASVMAKEEKIKSEKTEGTRAFNYMIK